MTVMHGLSVQATARSILRPKDTDRDFELEETLKPVILLMTIAK